MARNPAAPVTALWALTQSWAGRLAVACNPCAPSEVLQGPAFDGDLDIRQALAANPNTPASVLTRLTLDPEPIVRLKVALNPSTLPSLLWRLTQQDNPSLYLALLRNPNTPKAALEMIASTDSSLNERIRRHPNFQPSAQPVKVYRREQVRTLNLDCPVCQSTQGLVYGSRRAS